MKLFNQSIKKQALILLLIVAIAAFLRLWQVASVPPSLYWDEVSQGYNSFAILTTGRDEHQELFPLARFIAFGDYKAPVNIYLTVPAMAIFGKNEFSIRFVSAFLGILTVLCVYFLASELFHRHKLKEWIALLSALFLAISPWHVQLSRVAYEGNVGTFFTILGALLFLVAVRKKSWLLIASGVSFVLAFYSFNAHRVFIPLLILLFSAVYYKDLLQIRKKVVISGVVCIVLLLPILQFLFTPESKLRFAEVNIFSDASIVTKANTLMQEDNNAALSRILYNRRVFFAQEYISNYLDFFNPTYLFVSGDINPRFSHRANGQLYLWMLPLLLLGFYYLAINRSKSTLIIIGWFLLAPLAAATARETPHALRSETFIPTYELIAAIGSVSIYGFFAKRTRYAFALCIVLLAILASYSTFKFWHNYTNHSSQKYSEEWQYGYKETVTYLRTIDAKYQNVYFQTAYGRPSIYVAWYGDVSLPEYWKQVGMTREAQGLYTVQKLGKYQFVEILPVGGKGEKKSLYVSTPADVPDQAKILKRIPFLNGEEAFIISEI